MSSLSGKRPSRSTANCERALCAPQDAATSTRRLNVHVPEDLLRDIKVIAARQDTTISNIVRDYLERHRRKYANE
ncbi:MAG: ribbon-helix-helix protein, CopG family [Rhodospirillales bacterium]|nr:ribbon-helix-helix protein, CopG family [Rhodospirillales bacterium]